MRLFPSNESDSDANLDLVAVSGPAEGMRVHLDGQESVYLGRDHASIQIPDRMVSLRHCEIRFTKSEGYLIRDMGTVAGTFINGVRVRRGEERLNVGDELTVGETVFQVVSRQGEVVQRAERIALLLMSHVVLFGLLYLLVPRPIPSSLSWADPIRQGAFVVDELSLPKAFLYANGLSLPELKLVRVTDADVNGIDEVWLRGPEREYVFTFTDKGAWIPLGDLPLGCVDDRSQRSGMPVMDCPGTTWAMGDKRYEAILFKGVVVWGLDATENPGSGPHPPGPVEVARVGVRSESKLAGFLAASGVTKPVHYVLCEDAVQGVPALALTEDGNVAFLSRPCRQSVTVEGVNFSTVRAMAMSHDGYDALLRDLETHWMGAVDSPWRDEAKDDLLDTFLVDPGALRPGSWVDVVDAEHLFNPIAAPTQLVDRRSWGAPTDAPLVDVVTLTGPSPKRVDLPGCAEIEITTGPWSCVTTQACLTGSTFITVTDHGCGPEPVVVATSDYSGEPVDARIGAVTIRLSAKVDAMRDRAVVRQAVVGWSTERDP